MYMCRVCLSLFIDLGFHFQAILVSAFFGKEHSRVMRFTKALSHKII